MTDGRKVYPHPDSLPVAPLPPHESPRTRGLNITLFALRAVSFTGYICSSRCKAAARRDAINSRRDEEAAAHLKLAAEVAPSSAFFLARLIPGRRSWIKWSILQKRLHPQGLDFNELTLKPLRPAIHENQTSVTLMWCYTRKSSSITRDKDETRQREKKNRQTKGFSCPPSNFANNLLRAL